MKVYISNYRRHWLSPYTIYEKLVFWRKVDILELSKREEKFIEFITPISYAILKVMDYIHPQISYVKIDKHDTWSMDHTLAKIILPMLRQLKETKHGVPGDFIVDKDGNELPFEDAEKKWNNALDQMIFSFEEILKDDADDKFFTNEEWDKEGYMKYQRKVQRGLDLFGRHFRNLWT